MTVDTAGADVYDLAELWWDATSLPFVFAVWGLRGNRFSESGPDFLSALTEGRAAVDQIADRYAHSLGLDRASVVEYLTSNIHYELDGEGLAGLERFYRLAAEEGLITEPSPLTFWPDKG